MKNSKKELIGIMIILLIIVGFIIFAVNCNGQEGFFNGGEESNSSLTVSFTLGQTFTLNNTGYELQEFQGIQQAYGGHITSVNEEVLKGISVYPNPVKGIIHIQSKEILHYEIYDIHGKLIKQGDEKDVNVSELVPAPYYIKLKQNDVGAKTIKLIKK